MVRGSPFAMALVDGDGRLLAYSAAWLLDGISSPCDVAAGRSGLGGGDPDADPLLECLRSGAAQAVVRRPTPSGHRSCRIDLRRDDGGPAPLVWASAVDVTSEQSALAVSLQRQRTLELALRLDQAVVREADLVTGEVEVFGFSSDLVQDYALKATVHDDFSWADPLDRDDVEREIHQSVLEARAFDLHYRLNNGGGEEVHLHSVGEVRRGPQGEPLAVVSVIKDVTAEVQARRRIETLAYRDPLTGLANRALFQSGLDRVFGGGEGGGRSGACSLVLVDVDHFKDINDTLGHDAGDVLLRAVGEALARFFPAADTIARLGGDEFAVVLTGVESEAALRRAVEELQQRLREPLRHMGHSLSVNLSLGAVLCSPMAARSGPEALKQADIALYRAKALGRDRMVLFDPEMQSEAEERLSILREVRAGLTQGEFVMHYQPIVNLANERVCAFEALMRWNHPLRGLLSPAAFGAALDDPDLSLQLGDVALDSSLRQMRSWLDQGLEFGRVAVNVSGSQFRSGKLAEEIEARLRRWNVPADRLTIELTENIYLGPGSTVVASTVQALHKIGVLIALDDFGTGYASLSNLRQLTIDRLKIDRSFVQDSDGAVVRAMINLGSDLGIKVVAEGVETTDQLQALRDQGCEFVQGYIYGRPADPVAVTALLKRPWTEPAAPGDLAGPAVRT